MVIDICQVKESLFDVQKNFEPINRSLSVQREAMTDDVRDFMIIGYQALDRYLVGGLDLFQRENLMRIVELNHIVLCGPDWESNGEVTGHIHATRDHFFASRPFNITELVQWELRHRRDTPWKRAAGLYVGTLSIPQLFIEGNHRTGALLMSYVLTRAGLPPFVLTTDNAKQYFDPSSVIKTKRKNNYFTYFQMPGIKKKFGGFLENQSDPKYLCGRPLETT